MLYHHCRHRVLLAYNAHGRVSLWQRCTRIYKQSKSQHLISELSAGLQQGTDAAVLGLVSSRTSVCMHSKSGEPSSQAPAPDLRRKMAPEGMWGVFLSTSRCSWMQMCVRRYTSNQSQPPPQRRHRVPSSPQVDARVLPSRNQFATLSLLVLKPFSCFAAHTPRYRYVLL